MKPLTRDQIVDPVLRVPRPRVPKPPRAGANLRYWVSAAVLIGYDVVPIVGICSWGWNAFSALLVYWLETLVIGTFALLRMHRVAGRAATPGDCSTSEWMERTLLEDPTWMWALRLYGFSLVDGLVLFALLWPSGVSGLQIAAAVLVLIAAEAIHFHRWARDRTNRTAPGSTPASSLLGRLILLHFAVLGGGPLARVLETPAVPVLFLSCAMAGADLLHTVVGAFARERRA